MSAERKQQKYLKYAIGNIQGLVKCFVTHSYL